MKTLCKLVLGILCVSFLLEALVKADRLSKSKWQPVLIVMVCHVDGVSIRPNSGFQYRQESLM